MDLACEALALGLAGIAMLLLEQLRVVDGEGGLVSHRLEESHRVVVGLLTDAEERIEDSDVPSTCQQRDCGERIPHRIAQDVVQGLPHGIRHDDVVAVRDDDR